MIFENSPALVKSSKMFKLVPKVILCGLDYRDLSTPTVSDSIEG